MAEPSVSKSRWWTGYSTVSSAAVEPGADPLDVVLHPLLDQLQGVTWRDVVDGLNAERRQIAECLPAPGEVEDPAGRLVLRAVLPEGALVRSKTVVIRLDGRGCWRGQDLSHRGEPRGDLALAVGHLAGQLLLLEELLEVERSARVEVPRVEVHEAGGIQGQAGAGEYVRLDGQVVEMLVLHPAGGLHLDQPPPVTAGPDQDVGPDDDVIEGDEAFVDDRDGRIDQERRGAGEPLRHLEMLHVHQDAARVPLPGELPDPRPCVQDRLRPLIEGCRQLPGVDLQVEALGAL